MDNFDSSFIDCYMNNYKQTILERLNKLQLTNHTLASQCDLLCLILEETPKIIEEQREAKTYALPFEAFPILSQEPITTWQIEGKNNQSQLNNYHDKSVIDFIHSFINDIITLSLNAIRSLPKNNQIQSTTTPGNDNEDNNNDNNNEEEDEEDYFELIDRRNKQIEENERKALENKSSNPKKALSENQKIKVFLFQTMNYLEVELKSDDTFYSIKVRIIQQLKNANKLPNKNSTHDDYEFKDLKKNKLLSHALIETENVINFNKSKIVLVEKLAFTLSASSSFSGGDNKESEGKIVDLSKIHLRVHIKFDKKNFYSTLIQMEGDMPLSLAFEKLKSKLIYKNKDFYYFVEHSDKIENEDIDNAINVDIPIKYLPTFSLDLFMKTYSDIPDLFSAIRSQYFTNVPEISLDKKKGCESVDTNFLYNDINAGIYQEFEVTKINRHQTKQERILGIDLYNLYNGLPKKSSSFFSILQGKIRIQLRKLSEVIDCNQLTDKSFFIDVLEEGKTKRLIYEVKNSTTKNQIISKIKYLMVSIKTYISSFVIRNIIKEAQLLRN